MGPLSRLKTMGNKYTVTQCHNPEELMLRVDEAHGPLMFRGPQLIEEKKYFQQSDM